VFDAKKNVLLAAPCLVCGGKNGKKYISKQNAQIFSHKNHRHYLLRQVSRVSKLSLLRTCSFRELAKI
ncbi:hypothetical protein, partial [Escherichia coli]|uniref:hypothetical protein n=1 Tax=Escherichia coli TaxID=562 RepID=UPI001BC89F6B